MPTARASELLKKFESSLVKLYKHILEFYARALYYLSKHKVSQLLSDIFQNEWDKAIQDTEASEAQCLGFKDVIDGEKLHRGLEKQQEQLEAISIRLKGNEASRATEDRGQKLRRLFRNLYTCPYQDRKDRNRERVPGTCEWFTSHPLFQKWKESRESSLLVVSADPGCGKSVLARYLIDEVLPRGSSIISYFFFKDDFDDQRTALNAARSLLRQIIRQSPGLIDDHKIEELSLDSDVPFQSFWETWRILQEVANENRMVEIVCVLDALDECQDNDRSELIDAVCDLASSSKIVVKVLVTSRPYEYILRHFLSHQQLTPIIRLSGEDEVEVDKIEREIDIVIRSRVHDIGIEMELEEHERSFLVKSLTNIPHRTYLWVALTLNVIQEMTGFTKGNVENCIQNLPRSVDEAYEKILGRSKDVKKTMKLLQLVVAARRPLSLDEMSVALAIESHHKSYEEVEIEPEKRFKHTVRDLCGLFIIVVDSKIYLLHQTAREFLVCPETTESPNSLPRNVTSWKHSVQLGKANEIAAKACMLRMLLKHYPSSFEDYSTGYWHVHFRAADTEADRDNVLVELAANTCALLPTSFFRQHTWIEDYGLDDVSAAGAIGVAAHLDLRRVVAYLLVNGPPVDARSNAGNSLLRIAASRGIVDLVDYLLERGTDVNAVLSDGRTPLLSAARNGQVNVIRALLTAGADVNHKNEDGKTALMLAVKLGRVNATRALLTAGAGVNHKNEDGETALMLASQSHNEGEEIVDMLLANGADLGSRDKHGRTALHRAADHYDQKRAESLIKKGIDIHARDRDGETALTIAAQNARCEVVELLLTNGVNVDTQNNSGQTPLMNVANAGETDSIAQLLRNGAHIDLQDSKGMTALHWAAQDWSVEAVEILLQNQASVNLQDCSGSTPLCRAIVGTVEMQRWLETRNKGTANKEDESQEEAETEDEEWYTSEDEEGYGSEDEIELSETVAIVKLFLENGADPNIKTKAGHTALWYAEEGNNGRAAKLLREYGAVEE